MRGAVVLLTGAIVVAGGAGIRAERLPVTTYGVAEGLPHDHIVRMVADSRGFLWFCTPEGLARYDGRSFVTYDAANGLPSRAVFDLLEATDGSYWIATGSGLARFSSVSSRFVIYRTGAGTSQSVRVLHEDPSGTIWAGTRGGLYRLQKGGTAFESVDLGLAPRIADDTAIAAFADDTDGSLWIGGVNGLTNRRRDGSVHRYGLADGLPSANVLALLRDGRGRLWAGTTAGLAALVRDPKSERIAVSSLLTRRHGLSGDVIETIAETAGGRLFVGTPAGLHELIVAPDGQVAPGRNYGVEHGLIDPHVVSLAEDRHGNLWVGTETGGALRLVWNGLSTYRQADGLKDTRIAAVFEDSGGRLCVISGVPDLHVFDGTRFHAVRPRVVPPVTTFGWGWSQFGLQDRDGGWWLPTRQGAQRFARVARIEDLATTSPLHVYTTADGLPTNEIFRLFEDGRGDVWITAAGERDSLVRWRRGTGAIQPYGVAEGLPAYNASTAFAETAGGDVWIGFYYGGLGRVRGDRFQMVSPGAGLPEGIVRGLFRDRRGRLWIASGSAGVARIDDPKSEQPRVSAVYTVEQGLASNRTSCVIEGADDSIYVCTGRGVDRIDGESGRIRHYAIADGLPAEYVNVGFRAQDGALWFGTLRGLSRLAPGRDLAPPPHPVFISAVRVSGTPVPVSVLGQASVSGLKLEWTQNHVDVEFLSPSFAAGDSIRYQYRLEGAAGEWSEPTTQRQVTYASLRPGAYRFVVRAVGGVDPVGPNVASVAFTIVPPLWQRWWVLTIAAMAGALAIHGAYGYHVRRLLQLERVRTRIAADLHDDIGASLSRIAIMTEVVKRQVGAEDATVARRLAEVADSARDLVTSMSDIVWSVDPRHDDLFSLVTRLRHFASSVLESAGITWTLDSPADAARVRLTPEQRRHIFLALKEAIANAVRHANCRSVRVGIHLTPGALRAHVTDDGIGLVPRATPASPGNGLRNLQARVEQMGGRLDITSTPGTGTMVAMVIPLRGPWHEHALSRSGRPGVQERQ